MAAITVRRRGKGPTGTLQRQFGAAWEVERVELLRVGVVQVGQYLAIDAVTPRMWGADSPQVLGHPPVHAHRP